MSRQGTVGVVPGASRLPEPRWLSEVGPESDIVVSTRCRIARNIDGYLFPWRAGELHRRAVVDAVLDAATRAGQELGRAIVVAREDLSPEALDRLIEWRYASLDWTRPGPYRRILISPDGAVSVLINEEDHLRLQAILPGLQVELACMMAGAAVESLGKELRFAHDPRIGFLTASLTNAGTAMRIGVLLHLGGLAANGALSSTLEAAVQTGCAVRGVYGEGTSGTGYLFQVSNSCCFGADESLSAGRVAALVRYLIDAERHARLELFGSGTGRRELEEATARAVKSLFEEESTPRQLLPQVSLLRLAVAEGVLPGDLAATSEWVTLAGVAAAEEARAGRAMERFEAVRRTAAIRQRLRAFISTAGTSAASPAD